MKVEICAGSKLSVDEKPSIVPCGVRSITSTLCLRIYSCSEFESREGTLLILLDILSRCLASQMQAGVPENTLLYSVFPGRPFQSSSAIFRVGQVRKHARFGVQVVFDTRFVPLLLKLKSRRCTLSGCPLQVNAIQNIVSKYYVPRTRQTNVKRRHRLSNGQTFSGFLRPKIDKKNIVHLKEGETQRKILTSINIRIEPLIKCIFNYYYYYY